jgi:hypothetical protein
VALIQQQQAASVLSQMGVDPTALLQALAYQKIQEQFVSTLQGQATEPAATRTASMAITPQAPFLTANYPTAVHVDVSGGLPVPGTGAGARRQTTGKQAAAAGASAGDVGFLHSLSTGWYRQVRGARRCLPPVVSRRLSSLHTADIRREPTFPSAVTGRWC